MHTRESGSVTVATSIKDKNGDTALDLVPSSDTNTISLIRKARAQATISREDVVDGK